MSLLAIGIVLGAVVIPAQGQAANLASRAPLITQAVDETKLTTLTGNTYPQAKPQNDLGTAPATLPMERMLLVLKRSPAQDIALRRLVDQQHDPSSPNFHKWLTPDEFGQQFGPTDSDMKVITTWLESHGFQVGTTRGRTVLEFSGSASQVQEAFHTTIHKYLVNGEEHWANASDPQIPTALTPAVAGIDSLHDFRRKAMNEFVGRYSEKTKQLAKRNPQYTVDCQGTECDYAVSPYDFATIYDLLPLWNAGTDGTGQTIAIVGRSWINPADATTFWQLFGLTVPANKLNMIANGIQPQVTDDEAEADIDVQWSGAVAPQATIDFVSSQSTTTSDGIDLSALYIIENNLAPVMSESFGECELGLGTAGNQFYYALWGQAAAQGMSVFISAGDNGSAGCDNPGGPAQYGLNVNGLASTPFNAAIGGTDFNQYNSWTSYWNTTNNSTTQESAKSYIPETTWNDSCTNALAITLGFGSSAEQACNNAQMISEGGVNSTGGSGGPSSCVVNSEQLGSCSAAYEKPSWQKGTGVPNDHVRDLPDASLFASNGFLLSFYVICQQDATGGACSLDELAGYGGTSVASPAFAGIMALVNQKTGEAQGVPGFSLYQLASKEPTAFHDVPAGSTIAMPCVTGSLDCVTQTAGDQYGVLSGYSTTTGFDLATGLGSVDAANLVNNWSKATFTSSTTSLTLNNGTAVNVKHGTAVPVKIAVSPSAATGVAALLVNTGPGTTTGAGIDSFSLSAGSTTGTTSVLPGGTYNVIAHYGGDGTYGGSYSSPVSVTISKENSTVDFAGLTESGPVTTTTVTYDNFYWFRVDVENSAGQFCNPAPIGEIACPTGTITLTDNGNTLGSGPYPISTEGAVETASLSPIVLTGGSHTLKAAYSGDNSYNASSTSVTVTVNKAATNTSTPALQSTNFTQPVSMTVLVQDPESVQGEQAAPTGTVTFYSNGTALTGTVSYSAGSGANFGLYAALTHTFSAPGTYTITATYSGDQNYSTSTSGSAPLTLQYAAPSVLLTPASQTTTAGGTASVTALVDTTNKTVYPTGSVTFVNQASGATLAGPVTCANVKDGSGNYGCQAMGSFTVPSTMQVIANYSGDTNYPTSTSTAVTVSVPDFSVGTTGTQISVTQGGTQTITVNVSPLSGFNGTVSFACSGLPAEATCGFSPATVTGGSGSTTLTVTTAALGQAQQQRKARPMRGAGGLMGTAIFLFGVGLILVPRSRRRGAATLLVIAALFVTLPGCGGGGGGGQSSNPVPTVTSLSPTQQAAGSQSQALQINGSGFVSSSQAMFNGVAHATSFVSASQVTIALSASDMANQGAFPVVVTNPSPGGGASGAVNFNVVSGTPVGTFTVTVNATSGTLSHNTTFTLQVTQ